MVYLSIVDGVLQVKVLGGQILGTATTAEELAKIMAPFPEDVDAMCSSSVDFPEEYTSNPDVIALCRRLRS